jgi:hypothetical protein
MQITHCEDKCTSLILMAGESLEFSSILIIERDARLIIRCTSAIPNIISEGLIYKVSFNDVDEIYSSNIICTFPISGGTQPPYWRMVELNISFLAHREGRLVFKCQPGPDGVPSSDWLAISDLSIARSDRLSILKARSFHELQSKTHEEAGR